MKTEVRFPDLGPAEARERNAGRRAESVTRECPVNALDQSPNLLARFAAQRLAFAPLMFQACRALRDSGILELLSAARARGLTVAAAVDRTTSPRYAAELMLEAGLQVVNGMSRVGLSHTLMECVTGAGS